MYVLLNMLWISLLDSTKKAIPRGFTPLESSREGNCLYSSASLALLGNYSASDLLRFNSVYFAVEHFTEYLNWVSETIPFSLL